MIVAAYLCVSVYVVSALVYDVHRLKLNSEKTGHGVHQLREAVSLARKAIYQRPAPKVLRDLDAVSAHTGQAARVEDVDEVFTLSVFRDEANSDRAMDTAIVAILNSLGADNNLRFTLAPKGVMRFSLTEVKHDCEVNPAASMERHRYTYEWRCLAPRSAAGNSIVPQLSAQLDDAGDNGTAEKPWDGGMAPSL